MPLQKQPIDISFAHGYDQKSDPYRIPIGKFSSLVNAVFNKIGRLTKRNGYKQLSTLPNISFRYLTTFNSNLTAIGSRLSAYNQSNQTWIDKGPLQPISLSTISAVRSSQSQTQADSAVANGLVCIAYTENGAYKYVINDSTTGQNIIAPTSISADATYGTPRVCALGKYFLIVYTALISATYHLRYIAISTASLAVSSPVDISTSYTPSSQVAFDIVSNGSLAVVAWNGSDVGGAVRVCTINAGLIASSTIVTTGHSATMVSIAIDGSMFYISFYDSGSTNGYMFGLSAGSTAFAPVQIISSTTVVNLTSAAQNGSCTAFYEVQNAYSYDSSIRTDYIKSIAVTSAGSAGSASTLVRSVGLASKAFIVNGSIYFLTAYSSPYQPTYFLSNSSGQIIAKLAYSNGGGYLTKGLPNVQVSGSIAYLPYLYKDLVQAANKTQGASQAGIYSQTGINIASFDFSASGIKTSEIAKNLHVGGGFVWAYDGSTPVEHNFHLWPDSVEVTTTGSGGSITAQQYYYQVTYEWTDMQGNIHRSAPSVPVSVTTTGSTSTNTVKIPTLRLTYKSNVRIVVYRWSVAQQSYYQATSISSPLLNDPTVDSVNFSDTQADSSIIGNSLIYTTGGVLENIAFPAVKALTLFDSRLWAIDAEDDNLLWFSKQVIETVPVEPSDLLTYFVSPTTGVSGSTGPNKCIYPMDDKLIIFKSDAINYISGSGPINTGTDEQYGQPIPITSAVGCANQSSIIAIPQGLLFQSNKGIWLLGRDLSTNYLGAPVEDIALSATVTSATSIPETNQVRFEMSDGSRLMYDYYCNEWSTFKGCPGISTTIYNELETYINSYGQVLQETPGAYLDNTVPVLMSFTTGWISLAGLQGYERFYFMFLLGQYLSPFKLSVGIAYDYNPSQVQQTIITPENIPSTYGSEQLYGSGQFYGTTKYTFESRLFPQKQKCESFQISAQEVFDSSYGTVAGAGLTLSGLNLVVGMKKGYRTNRSSQNFG